MFLIPSYWNESFNLLIKQLGSCQKISRGVDRSREEVGLLFCDRLERGGSFDLQRQMKGGSSYLKKGIGTYLKVLFLRMEIIILLHRLATHLKYCSEADM